MDDSRRNAKRTRPAGTGVLGEEEGEVGWVSVGEAL